MIMIKWLKNLWVLYSKGAKASNFPIKECGLFGGKMNSPCNLDEAVVALGYVISSKDKELFQEWSEEKFVSALHHSLGRWIRNNWGLWDERSKLHKWFKALGIWHADDMSGIIITSYYRETHNLPRRFGEQVQLYIEYWRAEGRDK